MATMNVRVYKDLMGENEKWAAQTRSLLAGKRIYMLNLIGAPGCGKTALLERMASALKGRMRFAVLEGDIETTNDAERLCRAGVEASQLLSGGCCHLEAKLVHHALKDLPLDDLEMVVVENVGNMVCPAEFDIGEHAKIAVSSVTEGEDKPLKYPLLFREARAVLMTKIDLLPHLKVDANKFRAAVRQINGEAPLFEIAGPETPGFAAWLDWLQSQTRSLRN